MFSLEKKKAIKKKLKLATMLGVKYVNLTGVIISQCIHVWTHHIVYPKKPHYAVFICQ